jgi:hypothetical protein
MPQKPFFEKQQSLVAAVLGALLALLLLFFLPFLFTFLNVTAATVMGAAAGATIRYVVSGFVGPVLTRRRARQTGERSVTLGGVIENTRIITGDASDQSDLIPEVLADSLSCSVFAPPAAAPGDAVLVQAYAHTKGSERTALLLAAMGADPHATHRITKDFHADVPLSSRLGFHLSMKGIEVDDSDQEIVWSGAPESVQFIATIPEDFSPKSVAGKLVVTKGSTPIGHICFILPVVLPDEKKQSPKALPVEMAGTLSRYREAFISYASEDRPRVVMGAQMLTAARINFFEDILSLDPGDRWEKKLYEHIDKCDVFFLFWSKAASDSEWVREEALRAYRRQGGKDDTPPEIIPIPIDWPWQVPPPPELSFLHFNDKYTYIIKGVEAEAEAKRRDV